MLSDNVLKLIQERDTVSSVLAQNPTETPLDGA